jgi:hypothetical protein
MMDKNQRPSSGPKLGKPEAIRILENNSNGASGQGREAFNILEIHGRL